MTHRQCAAPGCTDPAKDYSNLCSLHRNTKTRHGHHLQRSIKVTRLAPYLRQVEARQKANGNSQAWSILVGYWSRIVEDSKRTLAAFESGSLVIRHERQAAEQVRTLDGLNDPTAIVNVVLAMFMMLVAEPNAFLSPEGFNHQLVRRVRSLVAMNVGSWWCEKEKRTKRVYRDIPPRAVAVLAGQLRDSFGAAGVQLADIEARKVDPKEAERKRLEDALEALQ